LQSERTALKNFQIFCNKKQKIKTKERQKRQQTKNETNKIKTKNPSYCKTDGRIMFIIKYLFFLEYG
jgi:hypothetical protein